MQKIFFYTTFGCHLCEQVEGMFLHFLSEKKDKIYFEIIAIDIIDDEEVLKKYRTSIPVLKNEKTLQELCWPFSYQELCNFLPV